MMRNGVIGSTADSDSVSRGSSPFSVAGNLQRASSLFYRSVAQLGRALRSGRRGRRFESCHSDLTPVLQGFFIFHKVKKLVGFGWVYPAHIIFLNEKPHPPAMLGRMVSQAKLKIYGVLKRKEHAMIYDRHPELQSKWDKVFWARGYYVSTIGNITEDAIKKYIKEQAEESRKRIQEVPLYKRTSNNVRQPPANNCIVL